MARQLLEFAPGFSAYAGGDEEARFIYKEIFEDHTYNVAELPDNAFIIDAGANIGMFTLYMKKKYPSSKILAFEPAPETFGTLARNVELHKLEGVELHECALGSKETTQTLTFYPTFPGNSTLVPEEKEHIKRVGHEANMGDFVDKMFKDASEISVPIKRLSHFLQDRTDLVSIDLLKVDVEGAELEVLRGLDDAHWALVRNVVAEICDLRGELDELESLLKSRGFSITREAAEWAPKEAKIFTVVARREAATVS
ncbi:amino acid adenylation domain-containing protein [Thelonectria olida]|uniref:Amino acid adenylation domain-containing protein n=1 Tax=Thelonectria olida TaxID=1576542 RepID=A0A9P9AVC0_9HYPO|nr:amino acid adenylation domain-containing protein [Thelonectria olida]